VRLVLASLRRSLRKHGPLVGLAIAVGLSLPGCASNERVKVAGDGAPEYQKLQVTYDLAATPELQRLDEPPAIEQTAHVDLAKDDQPAPAPRPWTHRRVHLEIQYPYPGVHPAFARATLRIVTEPKQKQPKPVEKKRSAWNIFSPSDKPASAAPQTADTASAVVPASGTRPEPGEPAKLPAEDQDEVAATQEVLYIDVPKTELDEVLGELAKGDFFRLPSNPDGASHLLVVYNSGRCEKGWSRQEHLDRLIELLRRHGAPLRVAAAPTPPKKA